jgi:hypothetical protein
MTILKAYWLCCLFMVVGIAMVHLSLFPTMGKILTVVSLGSGLSLFFAMLGRAVVEWMRDKAG